MLFLAGRLQNAIVGHQLLSGCYFASRASSSTAKTACVFFLITQMFWFVYVCLVEINTVFSSSSMGQKTVFNCGLSQRVRVTSGAVP